MTYQIRPATRADSMPLIGLYGLSGSGKTNSALLVARGLVGPQGKIVLIDTESGRGELYADVIPGGYDVLPLGEPYSPKRYMEAMKAAWASNPAVVVVDSGSHEWEGVGGVLDMATENEARTGKPGLHNWKVPKMEHSRFMLSSLQSPCPVIFCLRAKFKSRQVKNPRTGKSEIIKDDHTTPMQSDDFIYEMTVHGEMVAKPNKDGEMDGGFFRLTKCSHPDLKSVFRTDRQLSIETGQELAAWASRAGAPAPEADSLDPFDEAKAAAEQGKDAFVAFWNGPGKVKRGLLRDRLSELQEIATKADAAEEEDPFAGADQPAKTNGKATESPGEGQKGPGGDEEAAAAPSVDSTSRSPTSEDVEATKAADTYSAVNSNGEVTDNLFAGQFTDTMFKAIKGAPDIGSVERLFETNQAALDRLKTDGEQGPGWHKDITEESVARIKALTAASKDKAKTEAPPAEAGKLV